MSADKMTLSLDEFDAAGLLYEYSIGADGFRSADRTDATWEWIGFALTDARARSYINAMKQRPDDVRDCLLDQDEHVFVEHEHGWVFGALPDIRHMHYSDAPDLGVFRFAYDGTLLITARRRPLQTIDDIRGEMEARKRAFVTPGAVIDAVITRLLEFLASQMTQLFHEVDSIEDRIIGDHWAGERERLTPLRRRANVIHRHLFMLASLFRNLESSRTQLPDIDSEEFAERAYALLHDSEQLQARGRQLQEEIMARLSERTNALLYLLSVLTAVLMPATIITGLFGMNLQGIPFAGESEGFWLAVLLSGCASAAILLFVRRMGGRD